MRSNGERRAGHRRRGEPKRLVAVPRAGHFEAETAQGLLRDEGVDFVVLGEKRAARLSPLRLRRRGRRAAAARGTPPPAARRANAPAPASPASRRSPAATFRRRLAARTARTGRGSAARRPRAPPQPAGWSPRGRARNRRSTRSGRFGASSAARPDSRPSARVTLAPASARRAAIEGASNGELAMISARRPSSATGIGIGDAGCSRGFAFRQANREGED